MAGFRSDILKASLLAVLLAISLGAAAFVLNIRIGTRVPTTTPATLEAYTPRGGSEKSSVSNFYYYNENVPILAQVKDTWGNPIAGALVTFEIKGPPNSNIIILQTAQTNASGFATANLTAPYDIAVPETILGVWSTVATTEIAGTNITDSVAFEVKSPPTPYIDLSTDRGGTGLDRSSEPYVRNETVILYAKVSNGTGPVANVPSGVTFTLKAPNAQTIPLTAVPTNATGIAKTSFRIPLPPDISVGTWQVIATVKVNDQVLIDALTFECS